MQITVSIEQLQSMVSEAVNKALAQKTAEAYVPPVRLMDLRRMAQDPTLRRAASRETAKQARKELKQ